MATRTPRSQYRSDVAAARDWGRPSADRAADLRRAYAARRPAPQPRGILVRLAGLLLPGTR